MRNWFAAVDRDRSGTITASELATMQFGGKTFSINTAKMLLSVFDQDRSGNIGFFEYCALHKFISGMHVAFLAHDRDRSGRLDVREVCDALSQGGFRFTLPTIQAVMNRFQRRNASYAAPPDAGLDFETFLQMCAYLGQVKSTFEVKDTDRDGWIRLNLEDLVLLSVSLPSCGV